jgi:hypothetical protein
MDGLMMNSIDAVMAKVLPSHLQGPQKALHAVGSPLFRGTSLIRRSLTAKHSFSVSTRSCTSLSRIRLRLFIAAVPMDPYLVKVMAIIATVQESPH